MDNIFNWCVEFLIWLAKITGTTYNEINVIIFVIVWPIISIVMLIVIIHQYLKLKKLKKRLP